MVYYGKVFRPPSEARSLIIQATIGCSHNRCTFCGMYKEDRFIVRPLKDILRDLEEMALPYGGVRRIFLADGDALVMRTESLVEILLTIKRLYPLCERVGIYASPRSVHLKTPAELAQLKALGLNIAYIGLESGSDIVLERVNKGSDAAGIVKAARTLADAGIMTSVTVISGLGGTELWEEHAVKTGEALSQMRADFIGLLTLKLEDGTPLMEQYRSGEFELLTPVQIARETYMMLEHTDSEGSVLRSNHASNYLMLAGTLNADRADMLAEIKEALDGGLFRDERSRRL